jgi:hypothetical protein
MSWLQHTTKSSTTLLKNKILLNRATKGHRGPRRKKLGGGPQAAQGLCARPIAIPFASSDPPSSSFLHSATCPRRLVGITELSYPLPSGWAQPSDWKFGGNRSQQKHHGGGDILETWLD